MNTLNNRILALLMAAPPLIFGATGDETPTASTTSTFEYLPTVVVGQPISTAYPQPVCARCRILAQREATTSGEAQGRLSLTYYDEAYPMFEGRIELTVLYGATKHTETLLDVVLGPGEHVSWTLPPRASFSWWDVEHVWVEMVPVR